MAARLHQLLRPACSAAPAIALAPPPTLPHCCRPSPAPEHAADMNTSSCADRLTIPEEADLPALALVKALAFAEKSWKSPEDTARDSVAVLTEYLRSGKLAHCRAYKDEQGRVLGAVQIQLEGHGGDLELPGWMRHQPHPGEAYVEWIGCHPEASGRGIGTLLLDWADRHARRHGARSISLDVMGQNAGAVRLYERRGYSVIEEEASGINRLVDRVVTGIALWSLLGCRYWSVVRMSKRLHPVASPA